MSIYNSTVSIQSVFDAEVKHQKVNPEAVSRPQSKTQKTSARLQQQNVNGD